MGASLLALAKSIYYVYFEVTVRGESRIKYLWKRPYYAAIPKYTFPKLFAKETAWERWWWRKTPVEMWWWWRKTIEMWRWCGGSGGGKQLKCGGGLVMVVEENN